MENQDRVDKVTDIEEAIGNHARWMSLLRDAILQAPPTVDVTEVQAEDQCEFGKWLHGPGLSPSDRLTEYYREVRHVHAEFHELAGRIVELAAAGRVFEAYALLYGEYITLSGRLALAMRAWQANQRELIVGSASFLGNGEV